ncbi:MAG: LON peptidase substrate-binding domain-containing protein, partial [Thiothrix sp.]
MNDNSILDAQLPTVFKPASDDLLMLIPMRDLVLFPGMIIPITIGREQSLAAAQEAVNHGRKIGLILQRHPETETPSGDDLYSIGTRATILRYVTTSSG